MAKINWMEVFPIGSQVMAIRSSTNTVELGTVTIHTVDPRYGNEFNVRYSDGAWDEFLYSQVDLENPLNSYVMTLDTFQAYRKAYKEDVLVNGSQYHLFIFNEREEAQ